MSLEVEIPTCTSCNRPVRPRSRAVRFYCPNCAQVLIWRCELCRKLGRSYECINCMFRGP